MSPLLTRKVTTPIPYEKKEKVSVFPSCSVQQKARGGYSDILGHGTEVPR